MSDYLKELEKKKNELMKYCKWNIEAEDRLNDLFDLSKEGYLKGCKDTETKILKLVSEWYDTSIKEGKLRLMITNGGYINKFDLIKRIKELSSEVKNEN
jgi:hypothetical protein